MSREEDEEQGLKEFLPFSLEERASENGAKFVKNQSLLPMSFLVNVLLLLRTSRAPHCGYKGLLRLAGLSVVRVSKEMSESG